jgi:hypothetical protein
VKLWRGHFKSKAGSQYVRLLARDRAEAKILLMAYQTRRAGREEITYERLEAQHKAGDLTKEQYEREVARRKVDFARYDTVMSGPATDPMKLVSIEEVK